MDNKILIFLTIIVLIIIGVGIFSFNYLIYDNVLTQKQFEEHEMIKPNNNQYDLRYMKIDQGNTHFLFVEVIKSGYIRLTDDSQKYMITIYKFNKMIHEDYKDYSLKMEYDKLNKYKSIDGITVYTKNATVGEYSGESRFYTITEEDNSNLKVLISTPDFNETVKLTKSLEFNKLF